MDKKVEVVKGAKGVSLGKKVLVGSALALVAGASFAQTSGGIDVSAATDGLTQAGTAIGDIGKAMLAAVAGGVAIKWVIAYLI